MKKKTNALSTKLPFVKVEATGNDFILLDMRIPSTARIWNKFFKNLGMINAVIQLCDRNFGIGADGLVLLYRARSSVNHLRWDFFNSDGSMAEMCGNASRCVGAYVNANKPIRLETTAGVIVISQKVNGKFVCKFPPIVDVRRNLVVAGHKGIFINSSVPHFLIEVRDLSDFAYLENLAKKIKSSKVFGRRRTNVTFYVASKKGAMALTHERGVEAFTQSCGTGAIAVGWVLKELFQSSWDGKIKLRGGIVRVSLNERVTLSGPARVVFRGGYGV